MELNSNHPFQAQGRRITLPIYSTRRRRLRQAALSLWALYLFHGRLHHNSRHPMCPVLSRKAHSGICSPGQEVFLLHRGR